MGNANLQAKKKKFNVSLISTDTLQEKKPKFSIFQKIKQKFTLNSKKKDAFSHSQNSQNTVSCLPRKSSKQQPILLKRKKALSTSQRRNPKFTLQNSLERKEEEITKMKTSLKRLNTKDLHLRASLSKSKHRLSLLNNIGIISPTSPGKKNDFSQYFSKSWSKKKSPPKTPKDSLTQPKKTQNDPSDKTENFFLKTQENNQNQNIPVKIISAENIKEKQRFNTPLLRQSKNYQTPKLDISSWLTFHYADYLQKQRTQNNIKNENYNIIIKEQKAMSRLLEENQKKQKANLFNFEFEIPSSKERNSLKDNEFKEMIEYFRQIKNRNDFLNHKVTIKTKILPRSSKLLETHEETQQSSTLPIPHRNHKRFETLGNFSLKRPSFMTNRDRFKSTQFFSENLSDDHSKNETKIVYSPKIKSDLLKNCFDFNEKECKTNKNSKKLPDDRVLSIIASSQKKPIKIEKKKKKLIYFKNRIIEIDDCDDSTKLKNDSEKLQKNELFLKIVRSGDTPTKYLFHNKLRASTPNQNFK